MSGYEWHHKVKMVPLDGPEIEWDLRTVFADCGGPIKTGIDYAEMGSGRDDINLARRRLCRGWRVRVDLTFEIETMADHAYLADIVNRLCRDDWTVYLSLDNGTTYRAVTLERPPVPKPLRGKTVAGAEYTLTVYCADLLTELPAQALTGAVSAW